MQGIKKPLQGPVNTVGGMIAQVIGEATGMMDNAEKTTVSKMGNRIMIVYLIKFFLRH